MLEYKGYTAHVELDADAGIFHGEVLDTRDVITFQGKSVDEVQEAFHESVDDYLEFCASHEKSRDAAGESNGIPLSRRRPAF